MRRLWRVVGQSRKNIQTIQSCLPFEYHFMDEEYAKKFSSEQLTSNWPRYFRSYYFYFLPGPVRLATYMAEARIKEIASGKCWASVSNITALLSIDFVKLIIFSILLLRRRLLGHVQMAAGVSIQNRDQLEGFMTAGGLALIDRITYSQLSGRKGSDCKPCEELTLGIKNKNSIGYV